jgi:hypothetical protein
MIIRLITITMLGVAGVAALRLGSNITDVLGALSGLMSRLRIPADRTGSQASANSRLFVTVA